MGSLAGEKAARLQLGGERIDVVFGARALDAEGLDKAPHQVIAGSPLGQGIPQNLAGGVNRQVAGLTQIERHQLSLDLPPVKGVIPQPETDLKPPGERF